MPWINGRWVEEEQDWLNNMGIWDRLLDQKTIYDKGPGTTLIPSNFPSPRNTLPGILEGGDGVTPRYNPTIDESIINESISAQAPAPGSTTTSLFSMPAPYQRYVAPQQQVRYMAPRTPMRLSTYDAPGLRQTPGWRPMVAPQQQFPPAPPQRMMPPLNIPGRLPAPVQQPIYGPQMQPTMPPPFDPTPPFDPRPPEFVPPTQIAQPPVRPPFIDPPPPTIVRPPRPPVRPPIVQPPPPPPIIVRPPRPRPTPPPKRVKRTVASKPPATRPGRTQEGRGPRGARTITGVARSQNTQRGDR